MQEHACKDLCPRREDLIGPGRMPSAEQFGRDHAVGEQDLAFVVAELPQERTGAQTDQEIGNDRRADRGVVVIERDGKDHAEAPRGTEPPAGQGCGQEPTRPSCGLEGSAKSRFGMRPASRARRPPSTAARIAAALRRGSWDLAIAVLTSTASQPSSMARVASEAVPIPASSTTGTGLREQISSIAAGFAIPIPDPISEPSGITAAHPTSASFWQVTGSSLQ